MSKTSFSALVTSLFLVLAGPSFGQELRDPSFQKLDEVFSQKGKSQLENVEKYSWPRKDLQVKVNGVNLRTGLAFSSWAGFKKMEGEKLMTMGDLVLLPDEVNPVIDELQKGGIEITAVHNHLAGETPQVVYVHFQGEGSAERLAITLRTAIGKTKTPGQEGLSTEESQIPPSTQKLFQTLQDTLGRAGKISGEVLQISVPRKETIRENAMEIPSSIGLSTVMNFQSTDQLVATTGDFVLIADEVNPVIKELRKHGISITALHSHMLRETSRLFFMHFWGVDKPGNIAAGLKAALAQVNTR